MLHSYLIKVFSTNKQVQTCKSFDPSSKFLFLHVCLETQTNTHVRQSYYATFLSNESVFYKQTTKLIAIKVLTHLQKFLFLHVCLETQTNTHVWQSCYVTFLSDKSVFVATSMYAISKERQPRKLSSKRLFMFSFCYYCLKFVL